MIRKLTTIAALTLTVMGAHAFQGEANPNPPAPFQSMKSRAEVQAEAREAKPITNGGTGVHAVRDGSVDRASVRAGAVATARQPGPISAEVPDSQM
ncbi:MAG: DUF4148 domain-containing protein [Variovorax sp.]|nr:MAG: DUF4148 domain-containing protein [Variovorax sp.]